MENLDLNTDIKKYMDLIYNEGFVCYLVGGFIRDYILNSHIKDYDFCTNMPLDRLKKLIPGLNIMKENEHRNVGIIRSGVDIEFASLRGKNLKEDLLNRDFTINSMAVDKDGNLIDYFGGIDDIKNKKIKLIKEDGSGLDADPLRILRAIRLAIRYNFEIDDSTKEMLLSKKALLNRVAKERIYSELKEILLADDIEHYLLEYKEIFFEIIPELKECNGFNQYNDYHIYDVYTHIVKVVQNSPNNIYLRLSALFHDIGKPEKFFRDENGIGHFYGHPLVSFKIFNNFSKKYKLDNKTTKIVSNLVLYHEDSLSKNTTKIYKFYKKFDMNKIEMLFDLKVADALGQNPKYRGRVHQIRQLEEKYISIRNKYNSIKYNGYNLILLGIKQKQIGEILDDIKLMILTNKLSGDEADINKYVVNKYLNGKVE